VLTAGTNVDALRELRRTRRQNRLAGVHWIDALYRVYLAGLAAALLVGFASAQLPDDRLSPEAAADFASWGPAALGSAFAVGLAIAVRSGGRGGPLVLEAPVVAHELQAPIDRGVVLRSPAVKQLRFLGFAGAIVGAIIGEVAARRLPVNMAAAIAGAAAAFALAALLAGGTAMVVSGRRLGWRVANTMAVVILAWSAIDLVAGVRTSPLSLLANLAFWPITLRPEAAVGIVVALAAPIVGLGLLRGISIEAAMRRAGLVSQLRFAVTLQDVRTVVLLRRQLAQEQPRARPWIRLRRRSRVPAVWRRDWQSFLRYPAVRLIRMAVLAVGAGLALGAVWRGVTPMIALAGLALYIAGLDAAEPVAQEVDHPTRWESYPVQPGRLVLQHVPATFVLMLVVVLIATGSATLLVPTEVVLRLAGTVLIPVAAGVALAATLGTAQGAPDTASLTGLGPDMMGFVLLARLVIPPAIVMLTLLPLLAAGTDPDTLDVAQVSNATTFALIALVAAFFWLRLRKPRHL
jgi:hypothetical protein